MEARFYHPHLDDSTTQLEGDEAMHMVKVLRMQPGDSCELCDGKGRIVRVRLMEVTKSHVGFEQLENVQVKDLRIPLHIAIAPTKNMDRFEWFLEKATEMGVGRITPIQCAHSERKRLRLDRCQKILVAAMKQSQRSWLPRLDDLTPFPEFIKQKVTGIRLIAHCAEGVKNGRLVPGDASVVLIGPEGDFSPSELSSALEQGYQALSLGTSRLRTETAGIFVAACFNQI